MVNKGYKGKLEENEPRNLQAIRIMDVFNNPCP